MVGGCVGESLLDRGALGEGEVAPEEGEEEEEEEDCQCFFFCLGSDRLVSRDFSAFAAGFIRLKPRNFF